MKKIILSIVFIAILLLLGGFIWSSYLCYIGSLMFVCILFAIFLFIGANRLLKKTNWWKNKFLYTNKLVSNFGYRTYLVRNLDVVNVGSNPALFSFFYEDVLGENWSTGTQGLNMDFEILKYRFSFIKEQGTVLLPLVLFSSVSEYLNTKKGWRTPEYYVKYLEAIDRNQILRIKDSHRIFRYYKYPLLYNWKSVKYLFKDADLDRRMEITSQTMSKTELLKNADSYIEQWKNEFDIKDLRAPLNGKLSDAMNENVVILNNIISFLLERNLRPVIVFPPMSSILKEKISEETFKTYVLDFVDKVKYPQVKFLNYFHSEELSKNEFFFNALFMNQKGRRVFTKKVLKDLDIM